MNQLVLLLCAGMALAAVSVLFDTPWVVDGWFAGACVADVP